MLSRLDSQGGDDLKSSPMMCISFLESLGVVTTLRALQRCVYDFLEPWGDDDSESPPTMCIFSSSPFRMVTILRAL